MDCTIVLIGVLIGILTRFLFNLIKYYNNKDYLMADFSIYASVEDFLTTKTPLNQYFVYRFVPEIVTLLLYQSILSKHFMINSYHFYLLIPTTVSSINNIKCIFEKNALFPFKRKAMHLITLAVILGFALVIPLINSWINLAFISPSIQGIVDNIWAAFFISLIVFVFFKKSLLSTFRNDSMTREVQMKLLIDNNYYYIRERFMDYIQASANKYNTNENLLYSILIYEHLNRPELIRNIERLCSKITKKEFTQGIAQVKSSTPITDIESIEIAASILKNTNQLSVYDSEIVKIIKEYNDSVDYYSAVTTIYYYLTNSSTTKY